MKQPVVLRIFKGDKLYLVKQSTDAQFTIGRDEQTVNLPGDTTSPLHATIQEMEGAYWIMDLGSETGTRRNGTPVLESKLETGDIIEIGDYRIEFFIGAPRPRGLGENSGVGIPVPAPVTAPAPAAAPAPVAAPTPVPPPAPIPVAKPATPVPPPPQQPKPTPVPTPIPTPVVKPKEEKKPVVPPPPPPVVPPRPAPTPVVQQMKPPREEKKPVVPPVPPVRRAQATTRTNSPVSASHKERGKRWGKTFAPASRYSEVTDYVKPGKGSVVEVLVAWQERIIRTYHFTEAGLITAGPSTSADVSVPLNIGGSDKTPILRMQGQATVLIGGGTSGDLIVDQQITPLSMLVQQRGLRPGAHGTELTLNQGEMVRLKVHDQVSLIIRYTSDAPRPLMAPALDLTASESVGLIMAFVMTGILWLYMFLYTPPVSLADQANDEPLRQALIIVNPPKPPTPKVPEPPVVEATPPPVVAKMTPTPKKTVEAKQSTAAKVETTASQNKPQGAAADVAQKPNKTKIKELTSVKQGGSVKTAKAEGSQMQAPKKNIEKSSVMSAFGGGGRNDELAKNTSGAGELTGMANAATGKAGSADDRAGDTLGAKLKDTGVGGHGVAQVGVPNAATAGRGSGKSGYGEGGLGGGRKGVSIIPGGSGESFTPGYDKEAVRRVIQENINAIRACYERELNRSPDLQGKIVLTWSIGAGGRVTTGSVKANDMGNANVASCILARLKTLTFPDPPTANEVDVSYPFLFKN